MTKQLTLAEVYFLISHELEDRVTDLYDELSDITDDFKVYLAPSALTNLLYNKIHFLNDPKTVEEYNSLLMKESRALADKEFNIQYANYESKKAAIKVFV
jgi:hypothetical protein